MRLSDLKDILVSPFASIQKVILFNLSRERGEEPELENGCSVEYAVENYGNLELKRIEAYNDYLVLYVKGYNKNTYEESLRDDYKDRKSVAYDAVNYTGLELLDIGYGIDDYAIVRDKDGNVRKYKIYYDVDGNDYIKCYGRKLPISDFMRTDI